MKELFVDKNFGAEPRAMIDTINDILDEYAGAGYDLSLRQLYYQLVSKNLITNEEKSYKNLGTLVSDARLAGLIDWNMIKDRGREMVENSHWESPAEILEQDSRVFRIDRWEDQPAYVEVMVEKQALEGVLIPVCRELDVPFTANKGYSSSSALYEASKRFLKRAQDEKDLYVIYLGDHDPSGIDMSRDVEDRLNLFLSGVSEVTVNRVALNIDQIKRLKPPENPAKLTDSRADKYIQRFGRSSWELDAIEPRALASLVTTAVTQIIDAKLWRASGARQDGMKEQLRKYAAEYIRKNRK